MLEDRHSAVLDAALKARSDRQNWMTLWQELAEIFLPNRSDFTSENTDGTERNDGLFSSEPQLAARGLASAVGALLRPPGKMWFKAKTKDGRLMAYDHVRGWLQQVTEITYDALYDPRVNADKHLSEVDNDLVVLGTGIAEIQWNKADEHLMVRSRSLASSCVLLGRDGAPNCMFSFSRPTLRQIIEEFGEDKLTEKMRESLDNHPPKLNDTFELLHACVPNRDWIDYGGKGKYQFHSMWISVSCKELLDEKGYYEFPYVCPRWDTLTGEIYGRSPAMVGLPDGRVVLAMSKTFMEAGEFALRPPTWSYADMIRGDLELYPGGHTVVDMSGFQGSGAPIQPIQLGTMPAPLYDFYEKKAESCAAAFYRDILELPSARDKDMTATEINARLDQYLRQVAPIMVRVNDDYNAKLINRVFNVLLREGRYPQPPEEIFDQEIEFEYESPIKAAREKAEAMKVIEGLQVMLPFAEAKPDILDNIDFDAVARYVGAKMDLPAAIYVPMEKMFEIRGQREKQMKQMQQAEMAAKIGPAAGGMLKAASDAKAKGMLDFDNPIPIAAPGIGPDAEGEDLDALDAIYQEVA